MVIFPHYQENSLAFSKLYKYFILYLIHADLVCKVSLWILYSKRHLCKYLYVSVLSLHRCDLILCSLLVNTVGVFFPSHCLLLWGLSVWLENPSISLSRAYTRCSAPFKAHFLHSFHGRAPVKAWISRMNPFSSTRVYPAKRNFYMLWLACVYECVSVYVCVTWKYEEFIKQVLVRHSLTKNITVHLRFLLWP